MSSKRMTANPIKAPRYRPGKATAEASSSESNASDSEHETSTPIAPPPKASTAAGIASNLKQVDLNAIRRQAAAQEVARIEQEKALKATAEEGFVTESGEESEEEEEEEEGSEDEESSEEEEEAPRRVMMRPTFLRKDKRGAKAAEADRKSEDELAAEEEARRSAAANEIVEEQIRKDLEAKKAGKRNWDDEEDDVDDVDDTDDLDPESEYAAWKLRELRRIKREREAIEGREKELEEIERRKGLTEEERKAEDDEYIAKQKEEKDGKGKMAYMQKYYHKGAFYQDDAKTEGLDQRDIMGSRFADDVQNRDLLPQALQIRDMTKLGKRGATKYKDLKSEDTGRWGVFDERGGPRGAFGDDERFRPDDPRDRGGPGASGSNGVPKPRRQKEIIFKVTIAFEISETGPK
ncbi:splicing factor, Prp19-binding domain-containing protein [Amylocarpus encephaloides]|uniref:Splicing factor, Prp19-binding domain-containing protein n=1 Tax=Amylocarpus encephaloides TaxID=45428 RepID=A0A9P8C3D2_9HELO|nr:splicing factor, Prp19-binding domain-containing protein [Amylocarpus encephaloides]